MDALSFWKDSDHFFYGEVTENELLTFQANIESNFFLFCMNLRILLKIFYMLKCFYKCIKIYILQALLCLSYIFLKVLLQMEKLVY